VKSINKDLNRSNQFAISGIYGARLLIYGDCKNDRIIQSEVAHSILGNDLMSVEFKNQNSYHARLNAKLLIASNIMPSINTQFNNELSRVIVLKLNAPGEEALRKICLLDDEGEIEYYADGKPKIIGGRLDELLLPEMPHILHRARACYEKLCPTRSEFIIPATVRREMLESLSSNEEMEYLDFFEANMSYKVGGKVDSSVINKKFAEEVSKDSRSFANFKRFLEQKNIFFKRTKKRRYFENCTLKTPEARGEEMKSSIKKIVRKAVTEEEK